MVVVVVVVFRGFDMAPVSVIVIVFRGFDIVPVVVLGIVFRGFDIVPVVVIVIVFRGFDIVSMVVIVIVFRGFDIVPVVVIVIESGCQLIRDDDVSDWGQEIDHSTVLVDGLPTLHRTGSLDGFHGSMHRIAS